MALDSWRRPQNVGAGFLPARATRHLDVFAHRATKVPRQRKAENEQVKNLLPHGGDATSQESVAQSFFKRMPIQSLIENTRLDRPARLADGLELECALVRLASPSAAQTAVEGLGRVETYAP